MLPSPACPTTAIRRFTSALIRSQAAISSAIRVLGTHTSSVIQAP
jgi:hypothetical protein